VLAVDLVLFGLVSLIHMSFQVLSMILGLLALISGILLLVGRWAGSPENLPAPTGIPSWFWLGLLRVGPPRWVVLRRRARDGDRGPGERAALATKAGLDAVPPRRRPSQSPGFDRLTGLPLAPPFNSRSHRR